MRTFCIGVGLCLLLAVGADTVHAQNTIDLVPMINKCHAEGYELDSLQSVYLRDVPCDLDGDTIYAIEVVSLWSEDCYMFWSHKFQYSFVWWEENHTMYVERDEEYDVDVNRSEWDEVVEWYDTKTRYLDASRTGGFSAEIPELNAFATMSGSHSYTSEYNVEGFFANVLYNYKEKYFGSASFRRDATSYFAKDHRWGSFWSVGAAWIISKEKFMSKTSNWLDQLKVKASIGQQGNDNIGAFTYIDTYSLSKANDTSMAPTFRLLGNPEITWETMTNFNFGVEFSLWKGRLTGTLDYYYRKTADQLFWLSVPESVGTRGYYGNAGDIRSQGVELTLTGSIIRNKNFEWLVSANFSHNSSKILKLPESKITENGGYYEAPFWYTEDGPVNNYMTYAYAGVNEQGQALYYYDANLSTLGGQATNIINRPGTEKSGTTTNIGEASRYTTGTTLPTAFGGFGMTFRWKNFDASVQFDFSLPLS